MSYGIIRVQKFTVGAVRGIEIHDRRRKNFSHSNPDIDWSKSGENYSLGNVSETDGDVDDEGDLNVDDWFLGGELDIDDEVDLNVDDWAVGDLDVSGCDVSDISSHSQNPSETSFYNLVQERIKSLDLAKAVRKDAVVMAQALITSDNDFFKSLDANKQRKFFEDALSFIGGEYGHENIISATVHLDEKTPHMHVNFVPVTADGRLCAKELFTPKSLRKLQDRAFSEVFSGYGLERGETRDEKRKHVETAELKFKTLSVDCTRMAQDEKRLLGSITTHQNQLDALEGQIRAKEAMKKGLVDEIEKLNDLLAEKKSAVGILGKLEVNKKIVKARDGR